MRKSGHKLRIKIIRIFNTYGPLMQPNDGRVVSNFIVQALQKKNLSLYGDGLQTRSFCYVDDLVEGMMRMMASDDKIIGPINIGNPDERTILEIAKLVVKYTGSKSKIQFFPLPENDPLKRKPDISLAKKILKWSPNVGLEEGIKKTIKYFKKVE